MATEPTRRNLRVMRGFMLTHSRMVEEQRQSRCIKALGRGLSGKQEWVIRLSVDGWLQT